VDDQEPDSNVEEPTAEPVEVEAEVAETEVQEPETESIELADGKEHEVDPAAIQLKRLVGGILVISVGTVVLLVLTLVWALDGMPGWLYRTLLVAWGTPVVGFGYFAWQWPVIHHRHLRYRVDRGGVRIRRGVLWRKIISIPTTRVQHTDVSQGPLQRNLGLATLTVHTAGTEGASISLTGLNHQVALQLRDHLLPAHGDDG